MVEYRYAFVRQQKLSSAKGHAARDISPLRTVTSRHQDNIQMLTHQQMCLLLLINP